MKRIEAYEIINHGVEYSDYFQGCGVACTEFTDVATGIGCCESQALEDALDQLAQNDWDTEHNADLNADCDRADTTDICGDLPDADPEDEFAQLAETPWVHISVRVR